MNCVYTSAERQADLVVHIAGIGFAIVGALWLLGRISDRPIAEAICLAFYCAALMATLSASAAYNLATGPVKDLLRRLDHAMIFAMIAATYAPFVFLRLPERVALPLGAIVGGGCAVGVMIKVAFPRRFDLLSVALYLGMGWSIAWALGPLMASIGNSAFTLLVAGGCFYTLGVPFCLLERLRFHNALWHACVLAGAMAHFATMAMEFAPTQ